MTDTLYDVFLIIMLVFLVLCILFAMACLTFLLYSEWVDFKRDKAFYEKVERLLND